jgi:hypothetical protein
MALSLHSPTMSHKAEVHMAGKVQTNRRVLAKKVTSFNMYLDQTTQIQAIMEATGAEKDAPVLRTLLDEALAARRRRAAGIEEPEHLKADNGFSETLEALQTLMLRAMRQGEKSLRIEALNLELLQETLAEAHAARRLCWTSLSVPPLRERGISSEEITNSFDVDTEVAKDYAYGVTRSLMDEAGRRTENANRSSFQEIRISSFSEDEPIDANTEDNQPLLF